MGVSGVLNIMVICLVVISALSSVRVIIGPTPEDRMIGMNMVYAQVSGILVLVAVKIARPIYLDVALVYAILGFVGILAISRYISEERK
jgi:multicomponent Na+:H+ antiporter subunit F